MGDNEPPEDSELLATFSPKEAAVYRFLKTLNDSEHAAKANEEEVQVGWDLGFKTQDLLNELKYGGRAHFPVPHEGEYPAFSWLITSRGRTKGSTDIRIYDYGAKALKFFANMGSFKGMEKNFAHMFTSEPYPVLIEDRLGFSYKNPSFVNAKL